MRRRHRTGPRRPAALDEGMTAHALPRPRSLAIPAGDALFWPLAALAVVVTAHLHLAVNRAINWDEFYHYSQINTFAQGGWLQPLQTLHARLFAWALHIPGGPVEQIVAIRLVVFAFVMATAGSIYLVAVRFAERSVALVSVLLYLSAGFVLQHGTSFRADGLIAGLLMPALAVLARVRLGPLAIGAVAMLSAVAALESIKVVLYAPAFAGIAWLRWSEAEFDRTTLARLLAIPCAAGAIFALLYFAHGHSLGSFEAASAAGETVVRNSGRKMFAIGGLPYYHFILKAALLALVFALIVLATPLVIGRGQRPVHEKIALAGLWLPLVVVGFYHNTAPYFYVFILAPVAASCGPATARAIARYSLRSVCALVVVGALALLAFEDNRAQANQKRVISAAETIFGRPVAYFDFPAMMGRWPKANHFMTPWGQDAYLAGQAPSFREIMQARPVPLVIENSPEFEQLFRMRGPVAAFLPADAAVLRANYVRYWGPLFVAGRVVRAGRTVFTSEFLVPGPYTVLDASLEIDGRSYPSGAVIDLARGPHSLRATGPRDALLVWGAKPSAPSEPAPISPFWTRF